MCDYPVLQGSWGQFGAHLGLSAPGVPHVDPMNLAIWVWTTRDLYDEDNNSQISVYDYHQWCITTCTQVLSFMI